MAAGSPRKSWREGDIASNRICAESVAMPQMNVKYLKSVLQSIHLSPEEVSHRCRDLKRGPSLKVTFKSLFLNGLHVLQKMCTPSSISWPSSFTEMQDFLCDVVSHVTAEFICELVRSCSPSECVEECKILDELSVVMSSITSLSNSSSTVVPTGKLSHVNSLGTDRKEDDELTDQDATATYSELESIVCHDVKVETIHERSGAFMRQHIYEFSRNVPAAVALCRRGVRCRICFYLYKGPTCVERLVEHTKLKHPHRASQKHLNELRISNSIEKIVGDGMRMCRCQMCNVIGPGYFFK